ncbi:hypothetical protein E4631_18290 [Hymenobacter sp. UV11]|uniref:hypothetical protein n=1 Tax=Hymenobacter sp. UV11 TaxID=1849735 RepID=UPI00105E3007|nr:hypothetical protein [Hymenobacter sp. UV11]TDN40242.1 hypothetical protein A8B98_15295 [Hymenobacter sp. UV11]TFZ64933.1 hypothetical protein E4631_18290 [Hymenobacter sp. UV11]
MNLESSQLFDYQAINKFPLLGNAYSLPCGVSLRINSKLATNYLYQWDVWIEEVHVGLLATDCRLPQTKARQRFWFENEVLYTDPGWFHYLSILSAATGLRCQSIGILEIALDMQPKEPSSDARELLIELDDVYKYLPRKSNTDERFRPTQGKLQITHDQGTFYFGRSVTSANSSGKQIAVYCKSDEIEHRRKGYIADFHQANGLDSQRAILRVEVRLSSKYLGSIPSLTEHALLDAGFLEALFVGAVGQAFMFRDLSSSMRDGNRNLKYTIKELATFDFLNQTPLILPRLVSTSQGGDNDRPNISTVKRLTHELINRNAPETQAELLRFVKTNPAPKGHDWAKKIQQYARNYPGAPSPEQMARVKNILRCLSG